MSPESPALLQDPRFLKDVLSFFIFLAVLVSFLISPAHHLLAAATVNIIHRMQSTNESSLFNRPKGDIHHGLEKKGLSKTPREILGDDCFVRRQMGFAAFAFEDLRTRKCFQENQTHDMI
eukprot:TRINITY_DN27458_c0_g1_i1.p1 TRINITY_DN27458_c0_g1~~TRINITY_DN27458_c0_g1_i1.p1  ORF type:complete len:120 (-),score=10.73 TRINITY_DN27458_c0_g1_i1:265-624(-)